MERTDSSEINSCLYDQSIFDKGGKSIKYTKNRLFSKWCWEIWIGTCKKMKLKHQLTLYSRINSKWIKDLNTSHASHDIIKVLEENISSEISDIPCSNIFTNTSSWAREIKNKQVGLHQIKKLLHG